MMKFLILTFFDFDFDFNFSSFYYWLLLRSKFLEENYLTDLKY